MKFYRKATTEQAAELLSKHDRIALFAHTRPDGDAIGASVALQLGLSKIGKSVKVFCDTPLTGSFERFPETACVSISFEGKFDLLVAVDCGDLMRVGDFAGEYARHKFTLTIDHHCGEFYSAFNCLYPYSSTCGIVHEILRHLNVEVDPLIATYLYMGLCTDTGNFMHSNTDAQSFRLAAALKACGADIAKVSKVFFKDTSLVKTKLLGLMLNNLRTYYDKKLVLLYATTDQMKSVGADESDTEGAVQYAINVDTALVGVSVCQHSENSYKISMRGNNFDVRRICAAFGGGGHVNASGCMISGLFEDVIEKIVREAGHYLC